MNRTYICFILFRLISAEKYLDLRGEEGGGGGAMLSLQLLSETVLGEALPAGVSSRLRRSPDDPHLVPKWVGKSYCPLLYTS